MKKLLLFLLPVIALVFLMGGQRVFDNLYLVNIPHNGDSPALVISGGQVFEQDLVGVYAYLQNAPMGTLKVPPPASVLLGVATDNTYGSLLMTPSDFINELNTSMVAVAVRLRQCATVPSTQQQIVALT